MVSHVRIIRDYQNHFFPLWKRNFWQMPTSILQVDALALKKGRHLLLRICFSLNHRSRYFGNLALIWCVDASSFSNWTSAHWYQETKGQRFQDSGNREYFGFSLHFQPLSRESGQLLNSLVARLHFLHQSAEDFDGVVSVHKFEQ